MTNNNTFTTSFGVTLPWLIYGTAWKKERTADLVVKAVQTGFQGIDTACQPKHYNEPMVGEALTRLKDLGIKRESLYLQTKFTPLSGQDPSQTPYDAHASVDFQVAQSFAVSQENLQTDYIDTLILHSPITPHDELLKAWSAMEKIQKDGGARQLGISNCYDISTLKKLYADAAIKPVILQNRFYKDSGYDLELRQFCNNNNLIYQSFWTLTANPHILSSEAVQTLMRKYNKSESQIFFRYLNQSGIVPLTGTCSEQHMKDDLNVFDFRLEPDEVESITQLIIKSI